LHCGRGAQCGVSQLRLFVCLLPSRFTSTTWNIVLSCRLLLRHLVLTLAQVSALLQMPSSVESDAMCKEKRRGLNEGMAPCRARLVSARIFLGLIALASTTFPQHACFRSNRWCYCCSPADIGLSLLASFVHCPRHDGHVSKTPLPLPEDIIEPLQTRRGPTTDSTRRQKTPNGQPEGLRGHVPVTMPRG